MEFDPAKAIKIINTTACLYNFGRWKGDMYIDNAKVVNINNDVEDRPPPLCVGEKANCNRKLAVLNRDHIRKTNF